MRGSRTEPSDVTRLFFLCVCGFFFFWSAELLKDLWTDLNGNLNFELTKFCGGALNHFILCHI